MKLLVLTLGLSCFPAAHLCFAATNHQGNAAPTGGTEARVSKTAGDRASLEKQLSSYVLAVTGDGTGRKPPRTQMEIENDLSNVDYSGVNVAQAVWAVAETASKKGMVSSLWFPQNLGSIGKPEDFVNLLSEKINDCRRRNDECRIALELLRSLTHDIENDPDRWNDTVLAKLRLSIDKVILNFDLNSDGPRGTMKAAQGAYLEIAARMGSDLALNLCAQSAKKFSNEWVAPAGSSDSDRSALWLKNFGQAHIAASFFRAHNPDQEKKVKDTFIDLDRGQAKIRKATE